MMTTSTATLEKNLEIVSTLTKIESFVSDKEEQLKLQEDLLKDDFKAVVSSTNDFRQLKAFTE
jgi:hypothetical protein